MDPKVILETALHREDISAIEALMLMQEGDALLPDILETADQLNKRIHGSDVTYVRSKQINFTNICRAECSFCPFWRKKGQKGAYTMSVGEILRQIRDAGSIKQVEIQGGLNPDVTIAHYVEIFRAIKDEYPNLHVHGLSPSEIYFTARRSRTSTYDVLKKFRDAGLDSLTGDSADILNDKVRKKVSTDKLRTHDWVDVIRTAHRLGMPTTATMLFGHIEDEIQVGEHLDIIKNIQRETGGIMAFEPIPYLPAHTELASDRKFKPRDGINHILKIVALARIFYARIIPNIQVDWSKLGMPAALQALNAGANDFGPLAVDTAEIRSPEAGRHLAVPVSQLKTLLKKAGKNPVEREAYIKRVQPVRVRIEEPVLV